MLNIQEYIRLDTVRNDPTFVGWLTAQWTLHLHQLQQSLLVRYDIERRRLCAYLA
jgi:hypothetical protein